MSLGQRIRELRKDNHLTQAQLALQINSSMRNISKYELDTCAPNPETLRLLALALGTTVDYLVGMPNAPVSAAVQTSPVFSELLRTTSDFSDREAAKLLEYAVMLKKMRE